MVDSIALPVAVLVLGWLLVAVIGSWAYFASSNNENDKLFRLPRFITKR